MRETLPAIPVPLLGSDADAQLDLQAILHRLYDGGGYAKFIYDSDPEPPLSPEDAASARSLIPEAARPNI